MAVFFVLELLCIESGQMRLTVFEDAVLNRIMEHAQEQACDFSP